MTSIDITSNESLFAGDLVVENVVVPLDGSVEAERALHTARTLAGVFDAAISCVSVVDSDVGREQMQDYYERLQDLWPELSWRLPLENDEPSSRIVADTNNLTYPLLCMASHGRGRASTSVLGSVARNVLRLWVRPLIVCGPHAGALDVTKPVVACVNESAMSAAVVRTAGMWARAFDVPLTVLTVAEPAPSRLDDDEHYRRAFGPDVDAQQYVDQLAASARAALQIDVTPVAVMDPISVAAGLTRFCANHPASLIVAATRNRRGFGELILGSQATSIFRHAPVPVALTQHSALGST